MHCYFRLLGKPVTVEVNEKTSPLVHSIQLDISIGLAEVVECVFDRRGGTASTILGFSLPIDNILPDVCPVSSNLSFPCAYCKHKHKHI